MLPLTKGAPVTDADKAYAAAKKAIAEARVSGAKRLDLSGYVDDGIYKALNRLPPEIANLKDLTWLALWHTQISDIAALRGMTRLTYLDLSRTQISDFSVLQGMTGLTELNLSGTQISDISVLQGLTGLTYLNLSRTQISDAALPLLATQQNLSTLNLSGTNVLDIRPLRVLALLASAAGKNPWNGLHFKDTSATRLDPHIAEIAEIENNAERARVLFDYLKDWVPPGENPAPPSKPDPIFETILIDGKLELADDLPSLAEQAEPLKKALHQRLQSTVPDLARAAGNIFPKLAAKARVLAGLVEKPFAELDLLAIHLEVEVLQDRLERGSEDGVPFPGDVLGPLADVSRTGPGLTLGHEAVDLYITRVREARETPLPEAEEATHRALSQAMVNDPAANGPNSIAMEDRIAALEDQAQRQAGWKAKHKWLAWTLATSQHLANAATVGGLAGAGLELVFGVPVSTFIANNATLLSEVAATYGGTFFNWFAGIMGPVFLALGVKDGLKKGKK